MAGFVTGPDLNVHKAPFTFGSRLGAEGWLVEERCLIDTGDWTRCGSVATPQLADETLGRYADAWLRM